MRQTHAFTCEQVNNIRACVRAYSFIYWTFRVELSNDTHTWAAQQQQPYTQSQVNRCVYERTYSNWIESSVQSVSELKQPVSICGWGERIPCVCNRDKWRCRCEIWRNPYSQLTDSRSVLCCLLCISKRLIVMIVVLLILFGSIDYIILLLSNWVREFIFLIRIEISFQTNFLKNKTDACKQESVNLWILILCTNWIESNWIDG